MPLDVMFLNIPALGFDWIDRSRRNDAPNSERHGHVQTMTTPVYLLHGEGDNVVPSAETLWLASELPKTPLKAMLISPAVSHVDLDGAKPGVLDKWRLVHFFARVLRAAERNR